jgi:hypothetical protein
MTTSPCELASPSSWSNQRETAHIHPEVIWQTAGEATSAPTKAIHSSERGQYLRVAEVNLIPDSVSEHIVGYQLHAE